MQDNSIYLDCDPWDFNNGPLRHAKYRVPLEDIPLAPCRSEQALRDAGVFSIAKSSPEQSWAVWPQHTCDPTRARVRTVHVRIVTGAPGWESNSAKTHGLNKAGEIETALPSGPQKVDTGKRTQSKMSFKRLTIIYCPNSSRRDTETSWYTSIELPKRRNWPLMLWLVYVAIWLV